MYKPLELTGKRFGRWTVISRCSNNTVTNKSLWNCICDCGTQRKVSGSQLSNDRTHSCGCFRKERIKESKTKHDQSYTAEYRAWADMKNRCNRFKEKGIKVCDRWLNSFENFYSDLGPRPSKNHFLKRENMHEDYTPSNCSWGTGKLPTRSVSRSAPIEPVHLNLNQWSQYFGNTSNVLSEKIENA